jgi:membrane protease YdiL (CAAX protease family)
VDFDVELTAGGFIFSLLLSLLVFWIAKINRFFTLPKPSPDVPITFKQTLGAFLVYLIFSFIILPLALVLTVFLTKGTLSDLKNLPQHWLGWAQAIALWVLSLLLMLYCFMIRKTSRRFIFWGESESSSRRFLTSFGMGVLTCAISYPFVLLVGMIAKYVALTIWGEVDVEQVAVKQIEMTMGRPFLFSTMVLAVVFVVPFAEELLFRGFFQNYFKRRLGRKWAIALSTIVFALAHFAKSQGAGNFQLILTLAVLAFFLGFIYERQKSLWASYGLHVTFNAFNILLIIFSK